MDQSDSKRNLQFEINDDYLLQSNLDRVQELTEEIMTEDSNNSPKGLFLNRSSNLDVSDELRKTHKLCRQSTDNEEVMVKKTNKTMRSLKEEVHYLNLYKQKLKRNLEMIIKLNETIRQQEHELQQIKPSIRDVQREFAEYKMQSQFDRNRLEDQIQEMKDNSQDPSEANRLRQEGEQLKESLMQYWKNISKYLNEEFEEILQMGISSDANDIMNALLIIQEARQEQDNVDKLKIQELEVQVLKLHEEIDRRDQQQLSSPLSDSNHDHQISPQLRRELDEIKLLKSKLYENLEIKQMFDMQRQMIEKIDQGRNLEMKVNELQLQSQQQQQEKMDQMNNLTTELLDIKRRELQILQTLSEKDNKIKQQEQLIKDLKKIPLLTAKDPPTPTQELTRNRKQSFDTNKQYQSPIKNFLSENNSPQNNQESKDYTSKQFDNNYLQRFNKNYSLQYKLDSTDNNLNKVIGSGLSISQQFQKVQGDHSLPQPFGGSKKQNIRFQ